MTPEGRQTKSEAVKLVSTPIEERMSAPGSALPRPLLGGLMALGFGAVFGVLGMFFIPSARTAATSLIVAGGASAVAGVILVMRFAGDPRFDPRAPTSSTSAKKPTK